MFVLCTTLNFRRLATGQQCGYTESTFPQIIPSVRFWRLILTLLAYQFMLQGGKSPKIVGQTVLVTRSMMKVWRSTHVHDHRVARH
jgi:hypothetical protein